MIDVRDTHRQAMEKADQAVAAHKAGDLEGARVHFREACRLESVAAQALIDEFDEEPTRSVLFRSAASLAVEAGQFAYAAYLVACGLEGSPPEEIRDELRALLRTVRRETESEQLSIGVLGRNGRVARYLSSCTYLRAAAEHVRIALADRRLKGRKLSGTATRQVMQSTQDSLRAFSGDTSLCVDLFCYGAAELAEYVPVSAVEPFSGDWFQFAKSFVMDHEDSLLRANPIAGQIDELVRDGTLSGRWGTSARDVGIHALAANPVRAVNEKQVYRPALILLALASQQTAFDDELACQILSETVSLLEIVIQIGWRDEISERRITTRRKS